MPRGEGRGTHATMAPAGPLPVPSARPAGGSGHDTYGDGDMMNVAGRITRPRRGRSAPALLVLLGLCAWSVLTLLVALAGARASHSSSPSGSQVFRQRARPTSAHGPLHASKPSRGQDSGCSHPCVLLAAQASLVSLSQLQAGCTVSLNTQAIFSTSGGQGFDVRILDFGVFDLGCMVLTTCMSGQQTNRRGGNSKTTSGLEG